MADLLWCTWCDKQQGVRCFVCTKQRVLVADTVSARNRHCGKPSRQISSTSATLVAMLVFLQRQQRHESASTMSIFPPFPRRKECQNQRCNDKSHGLVTHNTVSQRQNLTHLTVKCRLSKAGTPIVRENTFPSKMMTIAGKNKRHG